MFVPSSPLQAVLECELPRLLPARPPAQDAEAYSCMGMAIRSLSHLSGTLRLDSYTRQEFLGVHTQKGDMRYMGTWLQLLEV